MSMEICAFVPDIDDSLITVWLERLQTVGMRCEIQPGFSFFTHRGFISFKLTLAQSQNPLLAAQPYLTGFNFSLERFSLTETIAEFLPVSGRLNRLLGKTAAPLYFVDSEIDKRLSVCRYCLGFSWNAGDIFELRMATVSAAIIAELTEGICSFPADNIWYDNRHLVEDCVREADDFENSLSLEDIKLYPFKGWLN
jgi:hypothetical protein